MVAVPSIGRAAQVTPRRGAPEADATRDLYERYARQIYSYCLHQLGNREEAEDAMQSTFLNAFRGLKRGVDPEFESAWLYKIAQNVCLTRQRSSSRRRKVESPGDLDAMQDFVPAHQVDSDELIRLPEALDAMPEQQRRALLLREWQGLSYKEIGEELHLSQAAVETLLFRARRTLAAGLTEDTTPKSIRKRLRAGGDASSWLALVKSLLMTGGAKVAATVATVAATSVVAATPAARHAVEQVVVPTHPQHGATPHAVVKGTPAAHTSAHGAILVASAPVAPASARVAKKGHRAVVVATAHHKAVVASTSDVVIGHAPPSLTDPKSYVPPASTPAATPAASSPTADVPAAPAAPAPTPTATPAAAPTTHSDPPPASSTPTTTTPGSTQGTKSDSPSQPTTSQPAPQPSQPSSQQPTQSTTQPTTQSGTQKDGDSGTSSGTSSGTNNGSGTQKTTSIAGPVTVVLNPDGTTTASSPPPTTPAGTTTDSGSSGSSGTGSGSGTGKKPLPVLVFVAP